MCDFYIAGIIVFGICGRKQGIFFRGYYAYVVSNQLVVDYYFYTWYVFVLVWIVYTLYAIMPKLNLCSLVNIIETTRATLHSFDEFKENKTLRILRLRNLMKLASDNEQNGVYVLVIGESENKDHMQLYGYKRKNTPWLAELALNKNTVVFENAYSNHTHTTPTLTYALSGQNQYDNIELDEAFSLIEAAQAVGYKTYWISNQSKYELWETPVTMMASAADVQHWLNVNSGDKLFTSYYDEKLVEKIPSYQTDEKMLIVVHVMGCHGAYRDRYPAKYRHFSGKDKNIDAYDNSVLYNDYVLQQIYNKKELLHEKKIREVKLQMISLLFLRT